MYETNRHAKCLWFLLESGVDPNILDQHGTPILCAVSAGGHDKLLEKLLDGGADPNARDQAKENKPALVLASEKGHHECVKLLMAGGADGSATYGSSDMCALHR
jgi:ankyrin repeat protein